METGLYVHEKSLNYFVHFYFPFLVFMTTSNPNGIKNDFLCQPTNCFNLYKNILLSNFGPNFADLKH